MIEFNIKNRFTGDVQVTAEIDCDEDTPNSIKLRHAVKCAITYGADLAGTDLRGAYLDGADLSYTDLMDANLTGVNLSDTNLRGAKLKGATFKDIILKSVPKIDNIHQKVYGAASKENALNMNAWHTCETTHCRAGWVTTLAGKEGKDLEEKTSTANAALLIYMASDPDFISREGIPDFHTDNETALADMKRLADLEAIQ